MIWSYIFFMLLLNGTLNLSINIYIYLTKHGQEENINKNLFLRKSKQIKMFIEIGEYIKIMNLSKIRILWFKKQKQKILKRDKNVYRNW